MALLNSPVLAGAGHNWRDDPLHLFSLVCMLRFSPQIAGIWLVAAALAGPALAAEFDLEAYRDFASRHRGNSSEGRKLFQESNRTACANCHGMSGQEKCGPNLEGIGDKYGRDQLIRAVLEPNADILPGYETTIIRTKDGEEHHGVLYLVTKAEIRLGIPTGERLRFPRTNVVEQRFVTNSIMPEGLAAGLSQQEFADLISYLETLKIAPLTGFAGRNQPVEIPRLDPPVAFRRFHSEDIRFAGPVWFGQLPGFTNQFLVLEHQEGKIWRLEKTSGGDRKHLFLDLSDTVSVGPVEGLMCLAFHPRFTLNRKFYLKHESRSSGALKTLVVERVATPDGLHDSGKVSRPLFVVDQPAYNHNGGCLVFGPDDFLYIGFGDGGPQRDPMGYCQNPRDPLGSILRIDVDQSAAGKPFGIPTDNPFLKAHQRDPTIMPETWAIGFREPWRFSFDPVTHDLWVGDVGQEKYEEVGIVRAGENHGWNVQEGFEDFSDEYRRPQEKYVPPIFAYPHSFGVSVTGGYVYRAKAHSSFYGVYIFGDYESRRLWGLKQRGRRLEAIREMGRAPSRIASFGIDADGELYVVGYEGAIYRLDLTGTRFQ
ncbi:MAG: PQQ-dependent sugar dehydrogenase [Verrucomicrobiota bacterium]